MKEIQLQEILIANPSLIEEGCIFLESEVNLNGNRCDLLFLDRNNQKLYVEVKLRVDDRAVGQLIRYNGLANSPDTRFMLAGFSIVAGLKEGIEKHGYEYKEINLEDAEVYNENRTFVEKKIQRNKSQFQTVEQLIQSFDSNERTMARDIFEYAYSLEGSFYYLSDGIMIKRSTRANKYLSITTKGNRVLFHVPIKMRDSIYAQFKDKEKIYIAVDKRDKNQIDIKLKDMVSLEIIKELIHLAYSERE
ncbi:endonuclease NucS domain-containing protein [Sporosarcina sp. FSL K6-5500]|uniref:endonuclease NucS domain-containing protein n=1 Tax=Sporosarcina sp. FSL K6-5500 TaxID=2921558 RepID=UPI0030FB861A